MRHWFKKAWDVFNQDRASWIVVAPLLVIMAGFGVSCFLFGIFTCLFGWLILPLGEQIAVAVVSLAIGGMSLRQAYLLIQFKINLDALAH